MTFTWEKESPKKVTSKVGSAVREILSKEQSPVEVGEIIKEYGDSYADQVRQAVEAGSHKYRSPFYIAVLHKKEIWALNVLRNWFVARQTKPSMQAMWRMFPNFMTTVYEVHAGEGKLELLWTLPSEMEARVVVQNWDLYDSNLVKWCNQALSNTEEGDSQKAG
jgi:hypothetical protein